jgi:AraC-like ligand binding domain
MQRFPLAGGCYVVPADAGDYTSRGNWHEAWAAGRELGSDALSMLRARITRGHSPIRCFPRSETAVFVMAGSGAVRIGDRRFPISRHDGIYVAPDEGFSFENDNDDPIELVMTICPECAGAEWLDTMPPTRAAQRDRVVSAQRQDRHATADRFYQLMVDERVGCAGITHRSRRPSHCRHVLPFGKPGHAL